ncbi:unnamed protein product [Gongylonema pulchrum]|uniref:DH domain-containing protein n=1 Tax=Gongylonema pulchrum TaxID=637853 RepID=A0A183E891_9BILA|nr:unnamed protein product [Gongylonema pulchrum]
MNENYVATLILESGKNCTDAHLTVGAYGDEDIHFLLDFDMAYLGADEALYDKYRKDIRRESAHLNDDDYRQQRLKVLTLFMQIPNIYATKQLRERFEAQARQNIAKEITELSK